VDVELALANLSARNKGLVVRRSAIAAGITARELDWRLDVGRLVRVHENVYRHPAVRMTHESRFLAAVLACGTDAVLSHRAAAVLHGFPGLRRVRPEVTTPHTDLPRVDGFDVHRAVRLRPFEVGVVNGIPVTAKGKTALDLCAVSSLERASEVIAEAVITKVLRPEVLLAAIERSGGQGRRGTRALRAVCEQLDELDGLESVLELHGARALASANVPSGIAQFDLVCDDGRSVRFDRAWPEVRLAVDFDGKRWHGTPARKRATRARHESIVASDWAHLIYGWSDVHDTPADMRHEVETHYDRLAELAA
jgi:hypothetical protein